MSRGFYSRQNIIKQQQDSGNHSKVRNDLFCGGIFCNITYEKRAQN